MIQATALPTRLHVCPAKTRINLCFCAGWSESAWRYFGSLPTHGVPCKCRCKSLLGTYTKTRSLSTHRIPHKNQIQSNYHTYPYKHTVKQFLCLLIIASVLFVYFFIKAYVVCTHLNCTDLSMQFSWVPTTYAFIKKNGKINIQKHIFYGHSLPPADSRRAVVSFWRKTVLSTG